MKRAILAAIFLGLFGAVTPAQAHLGPSFDCSKAKTPFPELICSNAALSRLDLKFAQAYFALRQQVGQAGESALLQQAIAFHQHVKQVCGIPAAGPLPADTNGMITCVTKEYDAQRQRWISKLNGPARQEATMPLREHVALQRDLQVLGFLPATAKIDGVYGSETRAAIEKWQISANAVANISKKLPVNGILSERDGQILRAMAGYKEGISPQYRDALRETAQCVVVNYNNYVFAHPGMGLLPLSSIRHAEIWARRFLPMNGSVSIDAACEMTIQTIVGMERQ